jgi:1-acyl-sn-glycerol-3-phosphate acyltransferase
MLVITPPLALVVVIRSFFPGESSLIYHGIPRFWAAWALRVSGVRVTALGLENIAPGRPQILLPNHVSWFDVLALACVIPKRCRFVGKAELARVPLWGRAWVASGHIPIDRRDTQRAVASLDRAAAKLREDSSSIVIFPEGTRSADGHLLPFKKGAFMLALHTGIEIVPIGIAGSRSILPKGSWRVRSGRIIVRVGTPLRVAESGTSSRDGLMSRVRIEMEQLLAAPLPEQSGANVLHQQRSRP